MSSGSLENSRQVCLIRVGGELCRRVDRQEQGFLVYVIWSKIYLKCNLFHLDFYSTFLFQFDENVRLIVRRCDQSESEPVESQPPEGRSLKPGTPEPDGDSNQERAKDRGTKNRLHKSVKYFLLFWEKK